MKVEGSTEGDKVVLVQEKREEEEEEEMELDGEKKKKKRRRVLLPVQVKRNVGTQARRTRRRVQAVQSTVIQRLFAASKAVFKGPGTVPAPVEVDLLQRILDKMRPEDVGLSSDLVFFKSNGSAKGTPTITYTTIYKCNKFSIIIFFLPPRAVIPLHNHPGMTVFSKLLLGSIHIKSYDWVDPPSMSNAATSPNNQLRLAKLVADANYTAPCDTSILYPTTGGNMHTFRAITACAVLDVLGPPYSKEDDRDCTYYCDYPYSHYPNGTSDLDEKLNSCFGWLQEIDMPKDLKMDSVEYGGPQIIYG